MAPGGDKKNFICNLGNDPEIRYMPSGGAVANITLATSDQWKDKQSGENKERTEWHRIVFFNRLAEVVGEYLKKGAQVYIEGRLQTDKWQDKQGNDRYTTKIYASEMQMLSGRAGAGGANPNFGADNSMPANAPASMSSAPAAASAPAPASTGASGFDDEIPF